MAEEGRFSKKEDANKWLVVVGLILTGLLIGGGLVFAGYKLTQQKVPEFDEFGAPQATVPSPAVEPVAPAADEAEPEVETPLSGWETYTNAAYGYQFQHPADWNFSIDFAGLGIQSNNVDDYMVAVRAWDNPDELSLAEWIQFMKDSDTFATPTEEMDTSANTEVGGEDGLQFWSDPISGGAEPGECVQACPVLSIYFVHGDKAYVAQLNYLREFDEDSFILFSQILSTFEFLD